MEKVRIFETTNYTYIVEYYPTKYWRVIRLTNSSPIVRMIADIENNPGKTIQDAIAQYESLNYRELYE